MTQRIDKMMILAMAALIISLASVISVASIKVAEARVNNNDLVQAPAQLQDNVMARMLLTNFGTSTINYPWTVSTSSVLVDLSDTTNFKHYNTSGAVEVSRIAVDWSTETNATTTLKFGLIASTSPSGALSDVYWFDTLSFNSATGTPTTQRQQKVIDYSPSAIRLGLTSSAPASFTTNDTSMSSTAFATTSPKISPKGYSAPGVGDVVMLVEQQGYATTSVNSIYRVK